MSGGSRVDEMSLDFRQWVGSAIARFITGACRVERPVPERDPIPGAVVAAKGRVVSSAPRNPGARARRASWRVLPVETSPGSASPVLRGCACSFSGTGSAAPASGPTSRSTPRPPGRWRPAATGSRPLSAESPTSSSRSSITGSPRLPSISSVRTSWRAGSPRPSPGPSESWRWPSSRGAFSGRGAGLLAGASLAASPGYAVGSRVAGMDVLLTAGITLSLCCFFLGYREPARRRGWFLASGLLRRGRHPGQGAGGRRDPGPGGAGLPDPEAGDPAGGLVAGASGSGGGTPRRLPLVRSGLGGERGALHPGLLAREQPGPDLRAGVGPRRADHLLRPGLLPGVSSLELPVRAGRDPLPAPGRAPRAGGGRPLEGVPLGLVPGPLRLLFPDRHQAPGLSPPRLPRRGDPGRPGVEPAPCLTGRGHGPGFPDRLRPGRRVAPRGRPGRSLPPPEPVRDSTRPDLALPGGELPLCGRGRPLGVDWCGAE